VLVGAARRRIDLRREIVAQKKDMHFIASRLSPSIAHPPGPGAPG
jgi:hypothetical protein